MKKAIVTGASGFIGSHFIHFLKQKGYYVIGIDSKKPKFANSLETDKFFIADLRDVKQVDKSFSKVDELYMFAANMGGVGFIQTVNAPIMHDNLLININSLSRAKELGIKTVFFASSACVYPISKQTNAKVKPLKESDAYPADPDSKYGWEKLIAEQLCDAYNQDYGMKIHVARFHNIYGPESTYEGGREKSIAALCRKIASAGKEDKIEVWGDGKQTRSYCYIDDCCEGIYRLTQSNCFKSLNIGSEELVSINQLVDMIAGIANKKIEKKYLLNKPQGVRGRNSDNFLIKEVLNWEPKILLSEGLTKTYAWINKQAGKIEKK